MLSIGERVSLNHHLTSYPKNKSYEDIIELISLNDNTILTWEKFENDPDLIESIDYLKNDIENELLRLRNK